MSETIYSQSDETEPGPRNYSASTLEKGRDGWGRREAGNENWVAARVAGRKSECCQKSTKKVFQDGLGNNIPLRQFPFMLNK